MRRSSTSRATRAFWPPSRFPYTLEIAASLSLDRLTITTTVRPTSRAPVPIASGFQSYLRLPGVPRSAWQVTVPPGRQLILDERGIPNGAGERRPATRFELADRSFDDGNDGLACRSAFSVAGGGRTITVELESGTRRGGVTPAAGSETVAHQRKES